MDISVTVGGVVQTIAYPTSAPAAAASVIAATINGGGGGNTSVVTTPGVTTITGGNQFAVFNAAGAQTIYGGAATATVMGNSAGISFFESAAVATRANIALAGGNNFVQVAGNSGNAIVTGDGNDTVVAAGSGTIDVGAGANLVELGSSAGYFVSTGAGSDTVVVGTSSSSTVSASGSSAAVFGAAGSTVNFIALATVGGGSATLVAGAGNETIIGASSQQSLLMAAGTGNSALTGGSGNDTVLSGNGGSATMTGGPGSNAFAFFQSGVGGATDVITDFTVNDAVFIEGYGAGSASALQLAATVGAAGVTLRLSDSTTITFSNLTDASQLNGRIQYTAGAVCYAGGTRIATPAGELPVETLQPGKQVITLVDGQEVPQTVTWLGHRRISLPGHTRPETVAPIRIRRDAFADGMPHRDLVVSPDHAIHVDGKLICARQLVNGATIRQELDWMAVDYYHVELDRHAILLAEGLPAESYIDTGNSGFFANAGAPQVLHPDLTDASDCPTREAGSCAPFVWDEASVQPVWRFLADRAAALGRPVQRLATTTEPGLRLVFEGRAIAPLHRDAVRAIFALPRGASEVRLASRAAKPTDTRPWLEDRRRLGVRVARIVLRGRDEVREVPIDDPGLAAGWWAVERDGPAMRRWTNGEAVLPLPVMRGEAVLEVHLAGTMRYLADVAPVAHRVA